MQEAKRDERDSARFFGGELSRTADSGITRTSTTETA
jgi:hypothetical protein